MPVQDYLTRIGFHKPPDINVTTLAALHRAHLLTIPFENLDIHWGRSLVLELPSLFKKIIHGRRGGICYELNALFAWLLDALGFEVTMIAAEVFKTDGTAGPPFDHMALIVDLGEERYLADVGFGDSFMRPVNLSAKTCHREGGRAYRIARHDAGFTLFSGYGTDFDAMKPSFRFSAKPRQLSEFREMCVYHQTSPLSHFTRKEVCSLATRNGRITLSGDRVVETIGDVRTVVEIVSMDNKSQVLKKYFGIDGSPP